MKNSLDQNLLENPVCSFIRICSASWRLFINLFFVGYYDNLKTQNSFDTEVDCKEPATALLWLLYYLAQHWDHKKDFKKALETVDEAINHTPTLIELFMLKGKIFKHVGNLDEAVNCFDEAQSLDTADR